MSKHLWKIDSGQADCGCGCGAPEEIICVECDQLWPCNYRLTYDERRTYDVALRAGDWEKADKITKELLIKYVAPEYRGASNHG